LAVHSACSSRLRREKRQSDGRPKIGNGKRKRRGDGRLKIERERCALQEEILSFAREPI
jgi:hypothetical protein